MAVSFARYTASGSTDTFSVNFGYLDKSHVKVYLDDVLQTVTADYTWPTEGTIQLTSGNPDAGTIVYLQRETPVEPLVDFEPGNLSSDDMDTATLQALYVAEEARDTGTDLSGRGWYTSNFGAGGTIKKGSKGTFATFDASGNIIPKAAGPEGAEVPPVGAVADRDTMRVFALDTFASILNEEDGGLFLPDQSDLSGTLLTAGSYNPSSINAATDEVTFASAHGLRKCFPLYITSGNADLPAGEIVWVWRQVTNYTTIKLCPTFLDAYHGTNFIDLTDDSTMPSFRLHRDPTEGMVIIPSGLAKDGSQGGFRRFDLFGTAVPEYFKAQAGTSFDSGPALAMALHWARTSFSTAWSCHVNGDFQVYMSSIGLDHTGMQQPWALFRNITIIGTGVGKNVLSVAGGNTSQFPGVIVIGHATSTPAVGILGSRAHNEAHSTPMPASTQNSWDRPVVTGAFTKLAYLNMNCDLSRIFGGIFSNNYRGTDRKTTTFAITRLSTPLDDYVDGVECEYQEIIGPGDGENIGTSLDHLLDITVRRPVSYQTTPHDITKDGTTITVTFTDGGSFLSDEGINEGDPIYLKAVTGTLTLPEGEYSLKNLNTVADTADLWLVNESSEFDGSGVSGTYSSALISNHTGFALLIGGGMRGINMRGYILVSAPVAGRIDLKDGDVNRLETAFIAENGVDTNWYLEPHATEHRKITEWTNRPMGDLIRHSHIRRPSAGGDITLDTYVHRDAYQQAGTAANTSARLFGGTLSKLHLKNFDIRVSSTHLLNTFDGSTFGSEPSGKVYDAQADKTFWYPKGSYAPTMVALTNLDAATPVGTFKYQVHSGNLVQVRGIISLDPTAGAMPTSADIPLPIAAALAAGDLTGLGIRVNNSNEQATIVANTGVDRATLSFISNTTSAFNMVFEFWYPLN